MKIVHTEEYILVKFDYPLRILSSSTINGGFTTTDTIINMKTTATVTRNSMPETLLSDFIKEQNLSSHTVGLLTAAPMKYAQFVLRSEGDIAVLAVVTAGVSNALNISERTITQYSGEPIGAGGTINTIVVTSPHLLDDGMVSSVIAATEAKTAALFDLQIKSILTGSQATGTGTDSVVIASGNGAKKIQYAGGHTLYGQILGEAVYTAVKRSLSKNLTKDIDPNDLYTHFRF